MSSYQWDRQNKAILIETITLDETSNQEKSDFQHVHFLLLTLSLV